MVTMNQVKKLRLRVFKGDMTLKETRTLLDKSQKMDSELKAKQKKLWTELGTLERARDDLTAVQRDLLEHMVFTQKLAEEFGLNPETATKRQLEKAMDLRLESVPNES